MIIEDLVRTVEHEDAAGRKCIAICIAAQKRTELTHEVERVSRLYEDDVPRRLMAIEVYGASIGSIVDPYRNAWRYTLDVLRRGVEAMTLDDWLREVNRIIWLTMLESNYAGLGEHACFIGFDDPLFEIYVRGEEKLLMLGPL